MARQFNPTPPLTPQQIESFWSKVKIGQPDECWEWQAGRTGENYGAFSLGKYVVLLSHRVAYFLASGIDPTRKVIRHFICDNPPCCNPSHLKDGSFLDNSQDAVRKGRMAQGERNGAYTHPERRRRGEENGNSKLTEAIVLEVLTLSSNGMSGRKISRTRKMALRTVQSIVNRETWKHVIFPPSSEPPSA